MNETTKNFFKNAFTSWYGYAVPNAIIFAVYMIATLAFDTLEDKKSLLVAGFIICAILYVGELIFAYWIGYSNLTNLENKKLNILSIFAIRVVELVAISILASGAYTTVVFSNSMFALFEYFFVLMDVDFDYDILSPVLYYVTGLIPHIFMLLGFLVSVKRKNKE